VGPHLGFWDSESRDFNAKPLHTTTSEIVKSEKEEKWDPIRDFGTRGVGVSNTIQQQTITFEKVKSGRRYDQYIEIFEFETSRVPMSKHKHEQTFEKVKKESGSRISGFRVSELHEFRYSNKNITKLPKMRKR
jgi:hypothetical protein